MIIQKFQTTPTPNLNSIPQKKQNLHNLSDKDLYKKCQTIGAQSKKWMREFVFLLPEVARRDLHRRRGYSSIYEFAAKLAGVSFMVVKEVLRLHFQLKNYPKIWHQVRIRGWSKVRTVVSVLDQTNQDFWLEQLKVPKRALEEIVKKFKSSHNSGIQKSFPKTKHHKFKKPLFKIKTPFKEKFGEMGPSQENSFNSQRTEKNIQLKFHVDQDTEFQFREFKKQLEKKTGKALTMGEVLTELLNQNKTQESSGKETSRIQNKNSKIKKNSIPAKSAHVPKHIQAQAVQLYSGRCAVKGCNCPYQEFHHPDRFSLKKSHQNVIPLCRMHHQLAHFGFLEELRSTAKESVDKKVRMFWGSHIKGG